MKICNFWSKKGHFSKIKGVLFREKGAYRLLLEKSTPIVPRPLGKPFHYEIFLCDILISCLTSSSTEKK